MPTADIIGTDVLGALLGVWSIYLLGLLMPGPNFLVIAGTAALQGVRGSLSLIVSIVAGSCLQVSAIASAVALLPRDGTMELTGRVVSALTLFAIAIHLWRVSGLSLQTASVRRDCTCVGMVAGLSIGLSNPITFGGIASQLLGPSAILLGSPWSLVAVLGIAVLGFIRSIVVAQFFSSIAIRNAVLAKRRPIAGLVAIIFTGIGLVLICSLPGTETRVH